ncbi:hypothetical protein F4703DRAFT_1903535 [Phycomyces blakesleeanus]
MCSKCFKEQEAQNKQDKDKDKAKANTDAKEKDKDKDTDTDKDTTKDTVKVKEGAEQEKEKEPSPVQKSKGRCFICRLKIPLAKQLSNKCRCEYVFCDSHRFPDKHNCEFDHASMDKGILAKNNPKLNDRPRGGRSFQRLDSL